MRRLLEPQGLYRGAKFWSLYFNQDIENFLKADPSKAISGIGDVSASKASEMICGPLQKRNGRKKKCRPRSRTGSRIDWLGVAAGQHDAREREREGEEKRRPRLQEEASRVEGGWVASYGAEGAQNCPASTERVGGGQTHSSLLSVLSGCFVVCWPGAPCCHTCAYTRRTCAYL